MLAGAREWRRRLLGRIPFNQGAADTAIRRAYRASGLPDPDLILWARGPTEAAQILRFIRKPPRRQLNIGISLLLGGAVLWLALALAAVDPRAGGEPENAVLLIAAVLAFYLVQVGARSLPAPSRAGPAISRRAAVCAAAFAYLSMMLAIAAVQHFALPSDFSQRAAALAFVSAAGALPGALLLFRIGRETRNVPDALRDLAPVRSVARSLIQGRSKSLSRLAGLRSGIRPHESLLQGYRRAYAEAFSRPGEFFPEPGGLTRARLGDEAAWMVPGLAGHGDLALFRPVPHLDGMEDVAWAAATDGRSNADTFAELAYRVDRLFPFRGLALAVRPATTVSLDADGRPHAERGPALAWADGTEIFAWRGRIVDRDLLDASPLTLWRIRAESDPDRRGILIDRYGLGRFLTENSARGFQADCCGTLYRLEQPGEPIVAVRVINSTPEPDGTFREFWLRVPPTMRTAREAVAWTFGLSPDQYDPAAQS